MGKLRKKRFLFPMILAVLLVIGISYFYIQKNAFKEELITYLEEQGCQKNEIEELNVSFSKFGFTGLVLFKEDTSIYYIYMYNSDNEIAPSGKSPK